MEIMSWLKPQQDADNGDIVIALLNQEEVTVKRLYKKDNQITLQPSNPLYKPHKHQRCDYPG